MAGGFAARAGAVNGRNRLRNVRRDRRRNPCRGIGRHHQLKPLRPRAQGKVPEENRAHRGRVRPGHLANQHAVHRVFQHGPPVMRPPTARADLRLSPGRYRGHQETRLGRRPGHPDESKPGRIQFQEPSRPGCAQGCRRRIVGHCGITGVTQFHRQALASAGPDGSRRLDARTARFGFPASGCPPSRSPPGLRVHVRTPGFSGGTSRGRGVRTGGGPGG